MVVARLSTRGNVRIKANNRRFGIGGMTERTALEDVSRGHDLSVA